GTVQRRHRQSCRSQRAGAGNHRQAAGRGRLHAGRAEGTRGVVDRPGRRQLPGTRRPVAGNAGEGRGIPGSHQRGTRGRGPPLRRGGIEQRSNVPAL
ncbi:MAG: hypothetical protein AVDCRST_MAG83-3153, partial [uncultured Arthrobacter sp.]